MKIERLDHMVLIVSNIDATVRFYADVLGMETEIFGEGRVALKYGSQKINLHEAGSQFEPKAAAPTPGSADLCFISAIPPHEALEQVRSNGVEVIAGPVARTGALGPMMSFYIRDPDKNLIEVASYHDAPR